MLLWIKYGLIIYGFILLVIWLNRFNVYICNISIDIDVYMYVYILNNLINNCGLFVYKFLSLYWKMIFELIWILLWIRMIENLK